ncbi:Uncharacterised protein [Chryseobacterium indologenes]|nr:Uncharacterised protein [Chryseobacterium indologenes]
MVVRSWVQKIGKLALKLCLPIFYYCLMHSILLTCKNKTNHAHSKSILWDQVQKLKARPKVCLISEEKNVLSFTPVS